MGQAQYRNPKTPGERVARTRGRRPIAAALVALALCTACRSGREAVAPPPGRIILVSMDTVRADHVSGFGTASTTPILATIAAEGVRFRNFYAASSYTLPSHMSIFTGLDPAEHGVVLGFARLGPAVETLAEVLARAGYRTQAFHEGVFVAARFGFDRGFERYLERTRGYFLRKELPEIVDWMRAMRDERYFLFLHTYAAHFPYGGFKRYRREHPERGLPSDVEIEAMRRRLPAAPRRAAQARSELPPETRALCTLYNQLARDDHAKLGCGDNRPAADFPESPHFASDLEAIRRSYDERIGRIDGGIGRIRETLRELDQWDDTLLLVTSDHGEAFFEHGFYQHDYVPFDEVLKVPLVISYPRLLRQDAVRAVDGLAWHLDLMPTILSLAGLAPPRGLRGRDLTPVMLGRAVLPAQRTVFPAVLMPAHLRQEPLRRVARQGDLKYLEGHARFGDAEGLLFDLQADPAERTNLRARQPADRDALARLVAEYEGGLEPRPPVHQRTSEPIGPGSEASAAPLGLSEAEKSQLRVLGYLE